MSKAEQILAALGGDANVLDLEPCITRLRVEVENPDLVDEAGLKATGAFGIVRSGKVVQVVVGPGGRHPGVRHRGPALMTPPLTVLAPVAGTVVAMADVPDPVFAGEIVGPGLAIDPSRGRRRRGRLADRRHGREAAPARLRHPVRRPPRCAGAPRPGHGAARRRGLHAPRPRGRRPSTAGDDIISWDPGQVEAGGRSPICPVVALQGQPADVTPLAEVGSTVDAGDPLLEWR